MGVNYKAVDQVVQRVQQLPSVDKLQAREARHRETEPLDAESLPSRSVQQHLVRRIAPHEYRELQIDNEGFASITGRRDQAVTHRTPFFDPGPLKEQCFPNREEARKSVADPSHISRTMLRPAEGFEEKGLFGDRIPGVREMEQLKREGRLLDILRVTSDKMGNAWASVSLELGIELFRHDGGLDGPNRKEILFLGYLSIRNGGIHLFLRNGRNSISEQMYHAMGKEGILSEAIDRAWSRHMNSGSVLGPALEEAMRWEKDIAPEKIAKIRARRREHILSEVQEEFAKDSGGGDVWQNLAIRLTDAGDGVHGPDRKVLTDIGAKLIRNGYFYMLAGRPWGHAVIDAMKSDNLLEPAVERAIAAMPKGALEDGYDARLRKEVSIYLGTYKEEDEASAS